MMKHLKIAFLFFILTLTFISCSRKNFSQEFMNRYITDTNWLYQMSYSPSCNFILQYGQREIHFNQMGGSYLIKRNRVIDEYIFTPFSRGQLTYYSKDLVKVRFSDSANCELTFVRNIKQDEYYLTPDSIVSDRFIINYMNKTCISDETKPDIKLKVQGIEITEVKKNRMIQSGVSPKGKPQN